MTSLRPFLDAFPGTQVLFNIEPIEPQTTAQQVKRRLEVTAQVKGCDSCDLRSTMNQWGYTPCPFTAPPLGPEKPPARFIVLGEGPGPEEARRGLPFIGPSGKLLRRMLDAVGLESDYAAYMNVVNCWPTNGVVGKGAKTRAPNEGEVRACREHLLAQVGMVTTPFILLVGATALSCVRRDLKVSTSHGRVFLWHLETGTRVVMPIYHPASILRQDALKNVTLADLNRWASIVHGQDLSVLSQQNCVICQSSPSNWDPDAIGYCERHWSRHGNDWKLAKEFWTGKAKKKVKPKRWEPGDGQQQLI